MTIIYIFYFNQATKLYLFIHASYRYQSLITNPYEI